MKEGTKSYLIGVHQFFLHPLWVLLAWRLEYGAWPKVWEIICIFLHDVGIIGKDYLSNDESKKTHWVRGAMIAERFFGWKGVTLIAGHTKDSKLPESKLRRPDKRSWLVCPIWFEWWNYWVEWHGTGLKATKPPVWRRLVADNLKKESMLDSHELYLNNRG